MYDFLRREHHDRWLGFEHEQLKSWLNESGLKHVRVEPAGSTGQATSAIGDVEASIGIFLATGKKRGAVSGGPPV